MLGLNKFILIKMMKAFEHVNSDHIIQVPGTVLNLLPSIYMNGWKKYPLNKTSGTKA